jgi:hypothetical protein
MLHSHVPVYLENTAGGDHAMARHFDTIAQLWDHIGDFGTQFGMLIHYQIEDEYKPCRQEFDKIYRAQDYCANNKDNLMWLPTKPTYLKHKKASPVWDLDLPCHTINHPPYNEEVLVELRGRVWDLIKEAVDDKKCLDPPDVVVQQLLGLESHFQGLVTQRGKRPPPSGGTRFAVDNIKKHPQWWHAFSMADAPDATPAVKFFYETEVPRAMRRK